MKKLFTILSFLMLLLPCVSVQAQNIGTTRSLASGSISGDNTMRFYRLAIPVTRTAYVEDFDSDDDAVLAFWQECEDFANRMFVPLGVCFDVVENKSLIMADYFQEEDNETFIYSLSADGTQNINNLIGSDAYDVGMWVHHRDVSAENSGLSADGGVYSSSTKGSGYSKADKWVVAHELGHMFGALHTPSGEGSLMDSESDDAFFSYPSIKKIRALAVTKGGGYAYRDVDVNNNAPVFDNTKMKDVYRIPKGACLAIPVYANDSHSLTYSSIGCSSTTVEDVEGEFGYMPHFASKFPSSNNVIDYSPDFTADINYNDSYYPLGGTDIPSMSAGSYSITFLVNDIPASTAYDYLIENPFYSNYAVWDATVEIVDGVDFTASITPVQNSYSAGQSITVNWGVNTGYFGTDSKVRITMSTDYGKTFGYQLADNVLALDGSCTVNLPSVNVGNVDVDFTTDTRSMRGGIIRVEEIDGVAYTLTTLTPENGGGFTITGGSTEQPATYTVSVSANDGGKAVTSASDVQSNGEVTLKATPDSGYKFVGWYNGDVLVSSANPYTFNVIGNVNYTAMFDKDVETFAVKVNSNNAGGLAFINTGVGTDVTTGNYPAYTMVTLKAVGDYNNSGYIFEGWYKGDECVSNDSEYTFTVESAVTYEARFFRGCVVNASSSRICYATIYDADGSNPSPGRKVVESGTQVLFDAYIDPYYKGYVFVGWGNVEGNLVSDKQQYLMTVTEDVTLMAVAELAHYQLTVSTPDATMGSVVATSATVEPGTSIEVGYGIAATISAIPNNGYVFVNWTLDGKEVSTSAEYAVPAINDVNAMLDVEYVANFRKVTEVLYKINVTVEPLDAGYVDLSAKEVEYGGTVTLTANAKEGYEFANWTLNGEIVGTETVLKVENVTKDLTYSAHYKATDAITGRYFRLRDIATGKYMCADEKITSTHSYGQVCVLEKNKNNEQQIFYFEKSAAGYKLKAKSGYYIKCDAWNVNTDANANNASVLLLEETENAGEFYIKWDNYHLDDNGVERGIRYFKAETASETTSNTVYVYCDAPEDKRATWALEEVADKSALQALITETTELFNEVAEENLTKIVLNGKITSNAAQNYADGNLGTTKVDGAGIAGLYDDDPSTYFHSRWDGTPVNEPHYLQVDLGENLSDFCFEYAVRKSGNVNNTSPAPTVIEVRVSADGNDFGEPLLTLSGTDDNLPGYGDLGKTLWRSDIISAGKDIRYIRLTVTASDGPGNKTFNNQYFFAMGTLNVYNSGYVAAQEYKELSSVTERLLQLVYYAIEAANVVNDNEIATTEEVEEARLALLAKKEMLEEAIVPSSFTLSQVTANDLMSKNEAVYLAVKNISGTNNDWFAGKRNHEVFDNSSVLVWEPVVKGQKGSYYIKTISGEYIQKASPVSLGTVDNAAVFTAVNATSKGSGETYFTGDGNDAATLANINTADDANLVRFVTNIGNGTQWINVENSSSDPNVNPSIRNGNGGYTVHFVYEATKVNEFAVKVGAEKFATFYSPVNVELPDNATAYVVNGVKDGNWASLVEVEGDVLAANTAILLYSETPVECRMPVTSSVADSKTDGSKLTGTVHDAFVSKADESSYYILFKRNGVVGMYNPIFGTNENKFKNMANKAYLVLDKADAPSESVGYRFLFPNTTAIDAVEDDGAEVKSIYDLSGRKLESIAVPGIYIVNGKKVMIF